MISSVLSPRNSKRVLRATKTTRIPLAWLSFLSVLACSSKGAAPSREPAASPATAAPSAQTIAPPSAASSDGSSAVTAATATEKAPASATQQLESDQPMAVINTEPSARGVIALGDSITDPSSVGGAYLTYLGRHCPNNPLLNLGKGADMLNQMRKRWIDYTDLHQEELKDYGTLIVYGGVNDLYSDETAFRTVDKMLSDIATIDARAAQFGLRRIYITVSPWGGFKRWYSAKRGKDTIRFNEELLKLASPPEVLVLDSYPLLSCGSSEILCPEYALPHRDGLHPGKKGHQILGEALVKLGFANCD